MFIFFLTGKESSFANHNKQYQYQNRHHQKWQNQQLSQQLSHPDFAMIGLPEHATAADQYYLDKEDEDFKEFNTVFPASFLTPELQYLFNYLFAESFAIPLNQLREKEISASYTTPRYILHHNLRIPSC
ncbi:hypothetical protein H7F33_05920 [Pedobacter sp. PAMC26386]|nr:hypothetical protein H7F33_05920 [Pedobacter sp. PAMC26386]